MIGYFIGCALIGVLAAVILPFPLWKVMLIAGAVSIVFSIAYFRK